MVAASAAVPNSTANTTFCAATNAASAPQVPGVETPLRQRPLEGGDQLGGDVFRAAEAGGQAAPVGLSRQKPGVAERVGGGQREPRVGGAGGHGREIDAVAALVARPVQAGRHHGSDRGVARVQPPLVRVLGDDVAHGRGWKRGRVAAPRLERSGADVADHTPPGRVQRIDVGLRCVEQIDLVDRHVERRVEGSHELNLP